MGVLDWLKEVAEQSKEAERRRLEERHENDPEKLQRALARHDALNTRSDVSPYEEPEPDLDNMSDDELEVLRLQTLDEIELIEHRQSNYERFVGKTSTYYRKAEQRAVTEAIGGLLKNFTSSVNSEYIRKKKLVLHKIAVKQKSRALPPPQLSPEEKVSQEAREKIASIRRLEAACDEDVARDPDHADIIIRHYRKAIDAIRERQ